jgi:hypothetical protein
VESPFLKPNWSTDKILWTCKRWLILCNTINSNHLANAVSRETGLWLARRDTLHESIKFIFVKTISHLYVNNNHQSLTAESMVQPWSQSVYRGADKSLARATSQCILFDGESISFDASLVIYINSTNIPPIMIINRTYETQSLLLL